MTLTKEQLGELRKLSNKRTKGNWYESAQGSEPHFVACGSPKGSCFIANVWIKKNAKFISEIANHASELIELAEKGLWAEKAKEALTMVERYREYFGDVKNALDSYPKTEGDDK